MVSSALQQAVASIQLKDYVSIVVITTIGYDYFLVFSDEIEYIWNKPWTWVSTLFVLARYSGLCGAICYALWGSTFLPGPVKTYVFMFYLYDGPHPRATQYAAIDIIGIFGAWNFWIFTCAADAVMILRLWALYNRSRFILVTLLVFCAMQAISFFIFYVSSIAQIRHGPSVDVVQVLRRSICIWEHFSGTWSIALYIFQITFAASVCLLIAIKSGEELLQIYKATGRFQVNRYKKLLVWEGAIYFAVILVFSTLDLVDYIGIPPTDAGRTVLSVVLQLQTAPIALIPRFILGLRKLYLRDSQGRRTGDIDTAFGLTSGYGRSATDTQSTIVFADVGPRHEGDERDDEIQMEEMNREPIHSTSTRV